MKPQFLYDEKGKEKYVLLDVKSFRKMQAELEDLKLAELYRREKPLIDEEIRQGKFVTIDEFKARREAKKSRNGRAK